MKCLVTLVAIATLAACIDKDTAQRAIQAVQADGARPDVMPVMLNRELPFRVPRALYAQRVQGNVTLRLYIDSSGVVWPESTRVVESSGYAGLDSAAVTGSTELHFAPAKTNGRAVSVSIMLPVFFRHPGAPPLPGDTILRGQTSTTTKKP